jgi:nucleotide-binding universal stress UspA family protein
VKQISRIVVAADLERGAEAIQQAAAWASIDGSEVVVCAALDESEASASTSLVSRDVLEAIECARAGSEVRPAMARGTADREVVRLAETIGADLLVVADGGGSPLARLLLGTVAQRVVRRACCPVLVARSSPKGGPVIAATDLTNPSLPVVRFAAKAARDRGSRLIALHCVVPRFRRSAIDPTAIAEARMIALLSRAQLVAERRIEVGPVAATIVEIAAISKATMIVVGGAVRKGLRFLAASTPEAVVCAAPCSTLVVR